jgi:hypothetical protein
MWTRAQRWATLLSLALAVLLGGAASSQTPARTSPGKTPRGNAARRTAWLYNKGSFKKTTRGTWLEQGPRGRAAYRETARTNHYVTLHDGQRNRFVRLYNTTAYGWSAERKKWHFLDHGRWQDPRKKPLNADRFPDERGRLSTPVERKAFPHLGREYEVLGPATKVYNCIAWAIGITNKWVWPARPGKTATVADFDDLYGRYGYRRVKGLNFDLHPNYHKLVLYAKRGKNGNWEPTHGARQLSDGSWSSKLGQLPLIRHLEPDDLDGNSYGVPIAVYVRPRKLGKK